MQTKGKMEKVLHEKTPKMQLFPENAIISRKDRLKEVKLQKEECTSLI